jgi:hypothetical protein
MELSSKFCLLLICYRQFLIWNTDYGQLETGNQEHQIKTTSSLSSFSFQFTFTFCDMIVSITLPA